MHKQIRISKFEFRNLLFLLLLAAPLFAQDEGGGGLPSSLFGGDAPISSRGNEANPMDAVKKFLAQSNVTLGGDQERALKPTIESAFRLVQDTVEKYNTQPGARAGRGGDGGFRGQRGPGGEGRRGAGGGAIAPQNPQLAAELQRINDDVLGKITAVLKPDQQAAFKKWQNDVIKKGGGFPALKIVMADAGAPLTAEQEPQIQAIYTEAVKTAEPELTTMTKVAKLLTAAQRKALLESRVKQ